MERRIINVLDPAVYYDCHIPNTENVPFDQLEEYAHGLPKDTELIIHCAHYQCPLARRSAHKLMDLGFTNVKVYEGGIAEWYQEGLPVQGACQMEFLQEKHKPTEHDSMIHEISAQELEKELNLKRS